MTQTVLHVHAVNTRTMRLQVIFSFSVIFRAFWNRWTLGLDFGPGNTGLWTEVSAKKHTEFGPRRMQPILCVFWPRFPEISAQSPAFPGPKSRPRVQRFQNAHFQTIVGDLSIGRIAQFCLV